MPTLRIPLTQGKFAIIDAEDEAIVSQYRWYALKAKHTWYAKRSYRDENGRKQAMGMHRLLTGAPKDRQVDHKNHDGLDNRRENLRICTHSQNRCNRLRLRRNTSGYIGVFWAARRKRWLAEVFFDRKTVYVGSYLTREEAARARDDVAKKLHGEFVYLNFPPDQEKA